MFCSMATRPSLAGETQLGSAGVILVLAGILIAVEIRRLPNALQLPFLLTVTLGNFLITTALKDLIGRARPAFNPFAATLGPSFPSGHSTAAAAFYAAAALLLVRRRPRRARALAAGIAVGVAVAVAGSRVLLDDHWLSDVIAGLALGWAWFAGCAIAFGGRMLEFGSSPDVSGGG
jgi:membrane-associated phospholipid phosphatase